MKVKKFDELNENFSELFKKRTYTDEVRSSLHNILESINGISEKAWRNQDKIIDFTKNYIIKEKIKEIVTEFEKNNERDEYCAEYIYSKFKNEMVINFD
jgi:hypothetical protein